MPEAAEGFIMADKVRWGVMGCGGIARKFIEDMPFVKDGVVAAVGSRSLDKAKEFAVQYGIPAAYGSYEQLAFCPDVDAVYIATPHPMHLADAIMCIEAGKGVLCEKPITLNALQTKRMIDAARAKGVFLMEAMWTRFVPATVKMMELIKGGAIGHVNSANIDFGYYIDIPDQHRLLNPELGGGALLDVGIYVVSMASLVFGRQPQIIHGSAVLGSTGVDINDSIIFDYGDGRIASLQCGCSSVTPIEAVICGTGGFIRLERPFYSSRKVTVFKPGSPAVYDVPANGCGYCYETQHVCECIKAGRTESDIMPLDETLEIMQTLDRIRKPWGLVYPSE